MIIVYGLFIYSIYEFLKFLFLATLGDIITTIKGNYDSPERDRAIKRDLWTVAKSIIAFIIACILFQILQQAFYMTASKVAHSIFIALQKPLDRFRRIEK